MYFINFICILTKGDRLYAIDHFKYIRICSVIYYLFLEYFLSLLKKYVCSQTWCNVPLILRPGSTVCIVSSGQPWLPSETLCLTHNSVRVVVTCIHARVFLIRYMLWRSSLFFISCRVSFIKY